MFYMIDLNPSLSYHRRHSNAWSVFGWVFVVAACYATLYACRN